MEEKAESLLLSLNGTVKPGFPHNINMSWGEPCPALAMKSRVGNNIYFEFLVANHKFDLEGIWLIFECLCIWLKVSHRDMWTDVFIFWTGKMPILLTSHDNNLSFPSPFLYRSNWHLKCIQWCMLFYFGYGWFYYGPIIHLEVRISAYSFFNVKPKVECSYSKK